MAVSKGLLALFGLAAVGGIAALAMSGGSSPASDGLDANLPDDVHKAVMKALAVETNQGRLLSFASVLRADGFPLAAAKLEAKAASLGGTPVINVPPAPQSFPPAPNQPPVFVPPAPPVILVQPDPSPPDDPVVPPFVPPVLPPDVPVAPPSAFDPGPLPRLPALPASAGQKTADHKNFQQELAIFYGNTAVAGPSNSAGPGALVVYTDADADGVIGSRTQIATWIFQRWSNQMAGTVLSEDGIPGPSTLLALQGANDAAVS